MCDETGADLLRLMGGEIVDDEWISRRRGCVSTTGDTVCTRATPRARPTPRVANLRSGAADWHLLFQVTQGTRRE
jgi:hypothetical protein